MIKEVNIKDFEDIIGEDLSDSIKGRITECDFSYCELDRKERDCLISDVVKFLLDDFAVKAGEHRINDWNTGWSENHAEFASDGDISSLIPKYFGKNGYDQSRETSNITW